MTFEIFQAWIHAERDASRAAHLFAESLALEGHIPSETAFERLHQLRATAQQALEALMVENGRDFIELRKQQSIAPGSG